MITFAGPRSTAKGFQKLLLRVALLPFCTTLVALSWLAYEDELTVHASWVSDVSRALLVGVPLAWVFSLWWGMVQARQLTRGLDAVMRGDLGQLPDEFAGLAQHLSGLQESLREQPTYLEALQRGEVQRQLLQRLAREDVREVELDTWAANLLSALQPTLEPRGLVLWLQEREEYVPACSLLQESEGRRTFQGTGTCWIETDGSGKHHYFLRVHTPTRDSAHELPGPLGLVLELQLDPPPDRLQSLREKLEGLAPLLAVSWANWTLHHELFARIRTAGNVIEALEDGVLTVDRSAHVLSANRAAAALLGRRSEELVGAALDEMVPLPQGTWVDGIRRGRIVPHFEAQVARPMLAPVQARIFNYLTPRQPATTGRLALTVVLRDVTRQKELEDLRSDFTATLSHELRTPLTSMKGYLKTLMHRKAREFDMDKIQNIVGVINGQADHLQKLIQELLEAARMRSEDLEIRPRPVELSDLLREAAREHPGPKGGSLEVIGESCWVQCDPERIRSVLDHLLSNAHKYSLPGGRIELGCQPDATAAAAVIWVRDEGVGIPLDQQEKIFEMYHRLDTGNRRFHYGVGVGLFIARRVVESHGGAISVESAPGCGSTFRFTLPLCSAESEAETAEPQGALEPN